MKRLIKKIETVLLLFILLVFFVPGMAEDAPISFRRLDIRGGLSQNTVHCIYQDDVGFMWFGTRDGLNRYDGLRFKTFYHEPGDPASLSDNTVLCMCGGEGGRLWLGTYMGGVNVYDPGTGKFTRFMADPGNPDGLRSNDVNAIIRDRDGVIWIGSWDKGLYYFDREKQKIRGWHKEENAAVKAFPLEISTMVMGRDGMIWIGSDGDGLFLFDPETRSITRNYLIEAGNPSSLGGNRVSAVVESRTGDIWVGTFNRGLYKLDVKTGVFTCFLNIKNTSGGLSENFIYCLYETAEGDLLAGSWNGGGLFKRHAKNRRFTVFKNEPGNPYSLSQDSVNSIFQDRSGIVWIGTFNKGINKTAPTTKTFRVFRGKPGEAGGITPTAVMSAAEDYGGSLWIGTRGGGLNRFDPEPGTVTQFRPGSSKDHGLENGYIFSLCPEPDGTLWVGTALGLYVLERNAKRFRRMDNKKVPDGSTMMVITRERGGPLWIGTKESGIMVLDTASGKVTTCRSQPGKPNSLSSNRVHAIYQTRAGSIWIGTRRGLNRFNPETRDFTRFLADSSKPGRISHNSVVCICEDHRGRLWLGTFGGGLNCFEPAAGRFTHYTRKNGLPNNAVYGILEDGMGNLWLSTNHGICRFQPGTGMFVNYTEIDGLQSDEFSFGAYFKGKDGRMFFGGINGLTAFYPRDAMKNLYIPPIVVTSVKIYGGSGSGLYREVPDVPEIVLRHDQNTFAVQFAALDYSNPGKNRCAYKLEGRDSEWIMAGDKRRAVFANLPPGEYVLRIKGSNDSGVWNEKGISRKIIIKNSPWSTWLPILAVLALTALTATVITIKRNRKKKEEERIKNLNVNIDQFFDHYAFTNREKEIIQLMIEGKNKKEIEDRLFISAHTVKNNIYAIYQKLNLKNRLDIIDLLRRFKG